MSAHSAGCPAGSRPAQLFLIQSPLGIHTLSEAGMRHSMADKGLSSFFYARLFSTFRGKGVTG